MCQQQFLEVYLEGTRSRSGKPSTARAGMLSIVVDALHFGSIADVLVVPVGISYDRIIEGNYNSEQLVRVCALHCKEGLFGERTASVKPLSRSGKA